MCPLPNDTHVINVSSGPDSPSDAFTLDQTMFGIPEGRHSVRLPSDNDVEITVGEDEPEKGAVEIDIASIEAKKESKLRKYFDKWSGGIDKSLPFPTLQDISVSWLGAFLG